MYKRQGTLRGLVCTDLKNNDEVIATLYERILGRVSVHDIIPVSYTHLSALQSGGNTLHGVLKTLGERPE